MVKVKVLTIGKWKDAWLKEAVAEYVKRLTGVLEITWVIVKDDKELVERSLQEPFIALDTKGKLLTSEEWSEKMEKMGSRLNFVIGGSDGLPKDLLNKASFIWSLSPLTFTHQLTRLVLIEQLYRATEISKGSRYHK